MEPERDSPYWDAIVGDNWPAISPGDWSALERLARDGAGALDLLDADRRRREFDERARSSAGLQPVKDDMVRQRMNPQAFADALEAAADTFRDFSDLVYRTRNKILDIVEEATARVNATKRAAAAEDDESDAEAIRSRIPGMIAAAREDVEDVVRAALNSISPQGLPSLGLIADALGQPGPWEPGHRNAHDHSGNDHGGDDRGQHRPATDHSGDPRHNGSPRTDRPKDDTPVVVFPENVDEQPVVDTADPSSPGDEVGRQPDPRTSQDTSTESPATGLVPGQYPPGGTTTVPVSNTPGGTSDAGPGLTAAGGPPRGQLTDTEPIASDQGAPADGGDHDAPGSDAQDPHGRGSDVSADEAESGTHDRSTTASVAETHDAAAPERITDVSVSTADPAASVAPPFVLPPPGVTPGYLAPPAPAPAAAAAAPSGPSGPAVSAPAAQAGSVPPQAQAKQTTVPPGESRGPAAAPKVTAVSAGPPPGAGAVGKTQPPERTEQRADAGKDEADDSDDSMRNVVGAAMTSAAAPAFVLGGRVDGDLVLARTLLAGVLAAGGDAVLGLGWAVSVMRHQSGITAFVTSNEGRGWIPAGLYLPREMSTPWVWEVAESAWEGVADPARVLAEFGLAWGRKSGARLTAVVSSEGIDAELRRQLGEVPIEGEVAASSAMDFSAARPSLVDRLELVAAPALVQRAAATPESEIGLRCWELASDAHVRVRSAGLGSPAALGAPAARERILGALRQRREVPQEWWEELRDADDLLTATMLSRRADVSRVALGELRADQGDGRYASEMSGLRAMVFERRCDELVLLLAEAATRQALRDAMYAHTQIVGHPGFVAPAPAPAAAPPRRPTITAGPGR
ncbi:hypothetical protein IFM12275_48250 [Nocardia sputorum]|uniref:hypothetical protein n=1 Tax=Nocardia sputorum TaxID=2984338 RepID=UPI0024919A04|nr:hypothetical protein [Nocardia sputorum]BDT94849.1 hypothetical protein IFM12275_48250 [Nocardia sputorum]